MIDPPITDRDVRLVEAAADMARQLAMNGTPLVVDFPSRDIVREYTDLADRMRAMVDHFRRVLAEADAEIARSKRWLDEDRHPFKGEIWHGVGEAPEAQAIEIAWTEVDPFSLYFWPLGVDQTRENVQRSRFGLHDFKKHYKRIG